MPKYVANEILSHNGAPVHVGEKLILSEGQAERLGGKVSPVEEEAPTEEVVAQPKRKTAKKADK